MPFPYTFSFDFEDHYKFSIDWDNSGCFGDGSGEDVTEDWLASYTMRIERGRDQIRQLAPVMAGTAEAELDNASRDYSRESSTGALYGNLLPGRRMRLRRDWNSTSYGIFDGYLDELTPHPQRDRRSVSLTALGVLSRLKAQSEGQKVSTPVYQSIRTDEAIGYILDAVSWSTARRTLDTGKTTLDWWWLAEEDALEAAKTIVATEGPGAALYEDADGNIVFESRHYRMLTARCANSQGTFSSTGDPYLSEPFEYNDGIKDVINACTVEQKVRAAAGSTGEVWSLGSTLTLAANETRKVLAKASDPFINAVTPVSSGSDYTVSAGSLTSVSIDRASGQNVTISLTAGQSGATVTDLRLRGQSVPVANTNLVSHTISSTQSQDRYGVRTYNLPTRAEVALNTLQDFTNAVVAIYKEPRPTVSFTVAGQSTVSIPHVLEREISDRVTVVEPDIGTTGDFFIEQVSHAIAYGGEWHTVQFGCEKADQTQYGRWGSVGTIYTRWASSGFTSTDAQKGVWGY